LCTVRLSVRLSQNLSQHEIGHYEATHVITDRSCSQMQSCFFFNFLVKDLFKLFICLLLEKVKKVQFCPGPAVALVS
jgi:hypothetical protein